MPRIKQLAFTLIELLVVIAIIGILSGLIVVSMGGVTEKANIAKSQVFSNSLRNSLMLNLVSEWKLDGNINDSWSGGNNGTWTGPLAPNTAVNYRPSTECVYGQCLNFDGTDDHVTMPNTIPQSSFTLSGWIKTTTLTNATILGQASASLMSSVIWIGLSSSKLGIFVDGIGNVGAKSDNNIVANTWVNFVAVHNNSTPGQTIYINGTLQSTTSSQTFGVASGSTYLGYNVYSGGSQYFSGCIDEIRIYNTIIPTSQIKEQYYAGLNKLFVAGSISKEEYLSKINQTAINE